MTKSSTGKVYNSVKNRHRIIQAYSPTSVAVVKDLIMLLRISLDDKFGYYIIVGLLTGTVFGLGFGAANGNHLLGLA
jgi:hypothetical protein